ncbi:MAG: insulinase family protein [Chloroflexi bacterium]|nr:insulinase family protein [Chloroflexota bacterium]
MAKKPMNVSLPGPEDIHREVLPNGITVLSRANFNSPSVVVSGYFTSGSLFESDEKLGLADFTFAALMRGTQKRDMQGLYDALESAGAGFGYDSGTYTSGFSGRSLAEDLPLLLDILAETIQVPTFPAEQIERLRAQMLTGLAIRAQDTSDMADLIFNDALFEGHPYARPEDGWPETIQSITREDMQNFHQRTIGPRGMVISIVGAVDPKRAVEAVQRALGAWTNPAQEERPAIPDKSAPAQTVKRVHPIAGKTQSDLIIGTIGPRRKDADFMAASLGNSVLGQFGMMGRIGDIVREKSGLAYYASSSLSAGTGPGSWEVSAGVNPLNVQKAADLIVSEMKRFVQKGVSAQELSDSQNSYVGRLPLSFESNGGVAGSLINIERFDLGLDYYRRYEGLVRGVTRAQVKAVAEKFIDPDKLVIAVAGP